MDSTMNWEGGRLVELAAEECRELLSAVAVGHIAWNAPDGPMTLPVNFTMYDDTIWIRTTPYSALAQACDDVPVAFEIDDIDPFTRSGWSVVVRGQAHADSGDPAAADIPLPETWPAGPRPFLIAVGMREVTGRRLLPG